MKRGEATFNDWLKALESGRYHQMAGRLGAMDRTTLNVTGNCCLGVMCRVNRFETEITTSLEGFPYDTFSISYKYHGLVNALSPDYIWSPLISVIPITKEWGDFMDGEYSMALNGLLVRLNDACICNLTACVYLKERMYDANHQHMFSFKDVAKCIRDHLSYWDIPLDTKLTAPITTEMHEVIQRHHKLLMDRITI